jgi:hypothetical protein
MEPVTVGAVLLAIISGAGSELGTQLWDNVVSLARRPFLHKAASADCGTASPVAVPPGEAELVALERAPADLRRAVALAEVLLARADADADFKRVLEIWWKQTEPVRANIGNAANVISGDIQRGPVLMGRDFTNLSFGAVPAPPPAGPPSRDQGA